MAEAAHPAAADTVAENLTEAKHGEGMAVPETGTKAVTIEHGGPSEAHADPSIFGLDATVWVSIAMTAFILILVWKKVPGLITRGLDNQIAAIRNRLDEAKQLRAEAEALRDEYARKIAGAEAQAQAMLAHADEEAKAVLAKAEADATELTARRAKMAEDKIAAAERAAIQAVRTQAAEAATRAAAAIIADKHSADADKALVDQTIAGLGRAH
ncbi:F-type H+-transporting ATPase subunit b [Sphingomonas naasensis]|uniref:ATP synthase subunit b n=1 Tax=Sphingomonas naasensis TaxID=1344951 RepID=A0A4S1W7Y2_9SPHN|nr:F0F1 ATP synthase subunit B [Sphingomonas naasensis]NIJ19647.1 F-type H+-transporting ATPase subunit b [Sphingomonas naasensis]TGX37280.1 F0F1 ATP synthase subunit B [Sphingomonas naasensis]